jgi:phage-related protein
MAEMVSGSVSQRRVAPGPPGTRPCSIDLACVLYQKRYIMVMRWRVEFLDYEVQATLGAFPVDIRASFERIVTLIESHGLERVREPYVKHLEGPVWEMRMKGRDGIARAAYVTATGRRVVVVHVFPKKTQKTPRREIEIALRRAKEVR